MRLQVYEPGSRLLPDTISASTLIFGFPGFRTLRNKILIVGEPGWHRGRLGGTAVKRLPSAQGDPGVMGSSPTSGSSAMSMHNPLPLPLLVFPLSLAVSISVE